MPVAEAERLREIEARVREIHLAGIKRAAERRRCNGLCSRTHENEGIAAEFEDEVEETPEVKKPKGPVNARSPWRTPGGGLAKKGEQSPTSVEKEKTDA